VSNTPSTEPPETSGTSVVPESAPGSASLQSLIPPTDDIDSDWGDSNDGDDKESPVSAPVQPTRAEPAKS